MADAQQSTQQQDDDVIGKAYDSRLMRRLLVYLRPYRLQVGVSLVAILLKAGSDVLGPYLTKVAIDLYMTSASWVASFPAGPSSEPQCHYRHHGDCRHLSCLAGILLPAGICPDLPDAMDRAKGDVRPAQPDLSPHPAHARGIF